MYLIFYSLALATVALPSQAAVLSDADACQVLLSENSILNENKTLRTLDGFVGVGWDDLMNRVTIPVLKNTYVNCKRVQDGTFLVPDNILVIPVLQTHFDRMANAYTSYKEYIRQSTDTISVSGGAKFWSIGVSGSYSTAHQEVKNTFSQKKSTMLHSKMVYHAYTLITDGSTGLNDGFVARLKQIIDTLDNKLLPQAKYLAELVVRDYGTHIVYKSDIGAVIEQEVYMDSTTDYSSITTLDSLRASAAANFFKVVHMAVDTGHTVSTTDKQMLSNLTHYSRIRTRGGPSIDRISNNNGIFTVDKVVSFSNEGMTLDSLITPINLPEWDNSKIITLQDLIRDAIKEYYERNTIRGCTEMSSPNFNYQANVDDNSCESPDTRYVFNGVFQKCTPLIEDVGSERVTAPDWRCDNLVQVNSMTKDFTCPANYDAVQITSVVRQFPDRREDRSREECRRRFLGKKKCRTIHYTIFYKDRVQIDSYWCRSKPGAMIPTNTGAMFGGIYTSSSINAFTGSASCPGTYMSYRLFSGVTVCLSYNYQTDAKFAIPFGGFFSCQSEEQKCPNGYTQHLIEVYENCAVFYCVIPEAHLSLIDPVIKRPPYIDVALASSKHSQSMILVSYNNKPVVNMPLADVIQNYTSQFKPMMSHKSRGERILDSEDIQPMIEDYINKTSEIIFDLTEQYPNKAWEEIENLIVGEEPTVVKITSNNIITTE